MGSSSGQDSDLLSDPNISVDLKAWLLDELEIAQDGVEPGPAEATFRLACRLAGESGLAACIGEEAMTGALLGAMMANFPSCVAAFGPVGVSCSWVRYRKGGRQDNSESRTGSDFGLVIEVPDGKARIAIFQAKMVKSSKIDLHHVIKANDKFQQTTQMQRLIEYATELAKNLGKRGVGFRTFHWVHYAAYSSDGVECIALSNLRDERDRYTTDNFAKSCSITVSEKKPRRLIDLLSEGCEPRAIEVKGWLLFDREKAEKAINDLLPIMDIYVADTNGDGRRSLFNKVHQIACKKAERKTVKAREAIVEQAQLASSASPPPKRKM
jgi:hypothetical protein